MQPRDQKRKLVVIVAGVCAFILGLYFLTSLISSDSIGLTVEAIPEDSTITLDGKQISAGKVSVTKGKHTFTVSRQLFETTTKTIDTDAIDPKSTIYLVPAATSDEAKAYLAQHPEIGQKAEEAGGQEFDADQKMLDKKYPILDELPYLTSHFKVDYSLDSNQVISFQVTLFPTGNPNEPGSGYKEDYDKFKAEALEYLSSKKINTQKTSITFKAAY